MVDYEQFRALHPEQENDQAEEKTEARHAGAEDAGGAEMVGSLYTRHWLLCQANLALLLIRWLKLWFAPESSTDSDFVWSSLLYLVLD